MHLGNLNNLYRCRTRIFFFVFSETLWLFNFLNCGFLEYIIVLCFQSWLFETDNSDLTNSRTGVELDPEQKTDCS
jgi:hypothetical protein